MLWALPIHPKELCIAAFVEMSVDVRIKSTPHFVHRFLPRIVEGELRVNMIWDTPIEVIVKKPIKGGVSATMLSGKAYLHQLI